MLAVKPRSVNENQAGEVSNCVIRSRRCCATPFERVEYFWMRQQAHGPAIQPCDSSESSHQHGHEHFGHSHHSHGHAHTHPVLKPSVLGWAMLATLGLVVAEIVGGLLGRSVALLNDAVHNLSDVPALGISWLAMRWAERPADSEKTYGYHRAGTLAAFTTRSYAGATT